MTNTNNEEETRSGFNSMVTGPYETTVGIMYQDEFGNLQWSYASGWEDLPENERIEIYHKLKQIAEETLYPE